MSRSLFAFGCYDMQVYSACSLYRLKERPGTVRLPDRLLVSTKIKLLRGARHITRGKVSSSVLILSIFELVVMKHIF